MCKVKIYHNWCKCEGLKCIDRHEVHCDGRNKPGHTVKEITYEVRNIPQECDKCIKLREEEEQKKKYHSIRDRLLRGSGDDEDGEEQINPIAQQAATLRVR